MASPKVPSVYLPFEVLPEGRHWNPSQAYRVKLVLRLTGLDEKGATFDVIDANSLEADDKSKRKFLYSDGGVVKM